MSEIKRELTEVDNFVWVISKKANVMKNDASVEELKEFAKWVKTFQH